MKAKYQLYGLDFEIWRERAMWVRDMDIEEFVLETGWAYDYEYDDYMPYTFTNKHFGSDMKNKIKLPKFENEIKLESIYLQRARQEKHICSLFDWATVIQKAAAIHTVNTSIIYLLEMLELEAPEVHLYQRTIKGQTFDNIKYILKRHKYVFHE